MNLEHAPFSLGGFQIGSEAILPVMIIAIVAAILLFGVRRELATFAIAAGVIGALLMQ